MKLWLVSGMRLSEDWLAALQLPLLVLLVGVVTVAVVWLLLLMLLLLPLLLLVLYHDRSDAWTFNMRCVMI